MRNTILLLVSILTFNIAQSQQIHRCSTVEYIESLSVLNPALKNNITNAFNTAKAHSESLIPFKGTAPSTIYRIPVVFHIVYNAAAENISDALIQSQLDVLNKDFRKQNADTANHRLIFKDRAADVGFEFFYATIDPDGNPTTGITRTQTTVTSFGGFIPNPDQIDEVKFTATGGHDAWDTDNYMNIWICNTGGAVLGFAYPPESAPNWGTGQVPSNQDKWGVVISFEVIGFNNPLATGQLSIADQGRTLVHETGHFFGLRHIWGDAGFFGSVDCDLTKDDGIDDTPHMGSNSQNNGCDFNKNTCTNGESPDEPDMPENYMDYSVETCQNMFTDGQAALLQSMAVTGRPDLAYVLSDDTIIIEIGDYIVVNDTDTIHVNANTDLVLNQGDQVVFLNENSGITYTNNSPVDVSVFPLEVFLFGNETVTIPDNIEDGIINISKNNSLTSIFPNPSNSFIKIKNRTEYVLNKIIISDLAGKIYYNIPYSNNTKENIDISALTNGLYFVTLYENDNAYAIKKFSIIK